MACTSLIGSPCSAAAAAQSSNSGDAFSTRPSRAGDLEADRRRPASRSAHDLAVQALALHLLIAHADRRRLGEQHRRTAPRASLGRRDDRDQRAGPVLLHLHRRVEHVERAGRVQPVHQRTEELRVHVVDLALEHDDALGRRATRPSSPTRIRSTFGCVREVAVAGAVADRSTRIAGSGPNASRVVGHEQRAGRRHQLGGDRAGVDRARPASSRAVAGAGTGKRAVRALARCRCRRSAATTTTRSAPSHSSRTPRRRCR